MAPSSAAILTRNAACSNPWSRTARAPASAASRSRLSGNREGRLAAISVWPAMAWRNSPARLVWHPVIRPRPSTSTSFVCEPGQRKTPALSARHRGPADSTETGLPGSRTPPRASRRPHPAVGPGRRGRSDARHESDRPRPDLRDRSDHHRVGQLAQARRCRRMGHGHQPHLRRQHPRRDDQLGLDRGVPGPGDLERSLPAPQSNSLPAEARSPRTVSRTPTSRRAVATMRPSSTSRARVLVVPPSRAIARRQRHASDRFVPRLTHVSRFFLAFASGQSDLERKWGRVDPPGWPAPVRRSDLDPAADGYALSLTQVKPFLMPPPRVSAFKPDQVWQQAREPMFWLDAALRVGWVNRAWEELTGQPAESMIGSALCRRTARARRRAGRHRRKPRPSAGGGRRPARRYAGPLLECRRRTALAADRVLAVSRPGRRPARDPRSGARAERILPACPIRRPTSSASASWSCGTGCIGRSDSSP